MIGQDPSVEGLDGNSQDAGQGKPAAFLGLIKLIDAFVVPIGVSHTDECLKALLGRMPHCLEG
jgi:hypothetical protein